MLIPPLLTLTLSLLLHLTRAEIRETALRSDSRPLIPLDSFGFTHFGQLDLNLTLLSLHLGNPPSNPRNPNDLSQVGFFLCTQDSWYQVLSQLSENDILCPLQSELITHVFSFNRLNNGGLTHFNVSLRVRNPNVFTLVFANCLPNLHISMIVQSSMYNLKSSPDPNTKTLVKDFLSAGLSDLPMIYFSFAFIYLGLLMIWVYVLYSKRLVLYRVHFFMLILIVLKGLNLLFEGEDKKYIKQSGSAHGWDVLFYIFSFLKGITLFTLIVLIGTGWSFLKPHLQDKEKRVLMIVIPLQVVANMAQVVIDETGPYGEDSNAWKELLLVVDLICCCAVLFPIVWSIRNLKEAASTDGKAKVNLIKLKLFRQYYVVMIVYIYFTRVIVYGLETITNYRYQWTSVVAGEMGTLVFYMFTGYNFRPKLHSPYFVIDDEEEEAGAEMLKLEDDEFES